MILDEHVEYLVDDLDIPFIRLKGGDYAGVCFKTGAISFPEEDSPIMQFEYDITDGKVEDTKQFEQDLGDFIVRMIEKQLQEKTLLYKGGEDNKT